MKPNVLVQLANESDLVKDYLGVPKDFKNITKITYNSVHRDIGGGQQNGVFVGKRKYKDQVTTNQLIRLAGGGVWEFLKKKYGENRLMEDFYNIPYFQPSLLKYGSGSFNPDADPESTTVDGYAQRATIDETWANKITGAGTISNTISTQASLFLQSSSTTDQYLTLGRFFCTLDTSTIGSGNSIDSADLKLYGTGKLNGLGDINMTILSASLASNNDIISADYNTLGNTSFGSIAYASFNTAGYNIVSLNSSGLSNIDVTGVSGFCASNQWELSGNPTWASSAFSYVQFYTADNGSNEPTLDATWSAAGWSGGSYNGVDPANIASVDTVDIANITSINSIT